MTHARSICFRPSCCRDLCRSSGHLPCWSLWSVGPGASCDTEGLKIHISPVRVQARAGCLSACGAVRGAEWCPGAPYSSSVLHWVPDSATALSSGECSRAEQPLPQLAQGGTGWTAWCHRCLTQALGPGSTGFGSRIASVLPMPQLHGGEVCQSVWNVGC